ncbi:MAG: hypothetical protein H6Q17_1103 [Bacteroidetes bacterium]|nr:hypothetical protein [Bacteroidota bacterium]
MALFSSNSTQRFRFFVFLTHRDCKIISIAGLNLQRTS